MSLWTHSSAGEATGGEIRGSWAASRVEIDSRKVRPGDLFVALRGERRDGHDFIGEAFARGATAAVATQAGPEGNYLLVTDTLRALEALSVFARRRARAKLVGITGSLGKTTGKEMLKLALSAHGRTFASSGNYNNHIGTPLSLANLPADADFAVMEMGMNRAGEIAHLTRLVRPHVAAVTTVEAVHLEFFSSVEAIARAKAEIFEGMDADGAAILNADNSYSLLLTQRALAHGIGRIKTFGEAPDADARLLAYRALDVGCEVTASVAGARLDYRMGAIGRHVATASLMTLAVAAALGLDAGKTAAALAEFSELPGRGKMTRLADGALLIDDSYNASPASMRAAFTKAHEVWRAHGGTGRKIAALGDMLELGEGGKALHAALANDLAAAGFDRVFTVGVLMHGLHEALPASMRGAHADGAMDLVAPLTQALRAQDLVLVKGSHGSHMHELAAALLLQGDQKHAV